MFPRSMISTLAADFHLFLEFLAIFYPTCKVSYLVQTFHFHSCVLSCVLGVGRYKALIVKMAEKDIEEQRTQRRINILRRQRRLFENMSKEAQQKTVSIFKDN